MGWRKSECVALYGAGKRERVTEKKKKKSTIR